MVGQGGNEKRSPQDTEEQVRAVQELPVDLIDTNPYQPRHDPGGEGLAELKESILQHGVIQPIVVTPLGQRYQVVAGERRLRACRLAGRKTIPAVVLQVSERDKAEMALIENLQRRDLTCLEEAQGYERLLREFGLTQEALAARVGKSQSAIANKLRLLRLPEKVKESISREIISERHARALLALPTEELQLEVLRLVEEKGLNVRQTEALVARVLAKGLPGKRPRRKIIRIFKDMRLFRNGLLQLIRDMKRVGLEVQMEEEMEGDAYVVSLRVKPAAKPEGE